MTDGRVAALEKMRAAGVGEAGIASFARLYDKLLSGDRGELPSAELEPVRDVAALDALPAAEDLGGLVVIRLNGGLGTTMGLDGPKSLIEVRPGRSFLDVIETQLRALDVPLLLMDSPASAGTHGHPAFLQHTAPRLREDDLTPFACSGDPQAEWYPPGHGDLYAALAGSGTLQRLLGEGFTHAFVANADNLGAIPEPRILAHVRAHGIPFCMEVVRGTAADRKGGHIARRGGRLVLRETAQAPAGEEDSFRDFERWRFYNTNNLWIDLRALDGPLDLPLIVNPKTVHGTDVLQLETAMGAALGVVDGAQVVEVPRTRFAPVKSTEDLLLVRSDAYELHDDGRLLPVGDPPLVELDQALIKTLRQLEERFPDGPPSLRGAGRFSVGADGTVKRG